MMVEFRALLKRKDLRAMILSYDTTFDLGDFYVSILTFRQTEFEEEPVIPLLYLIHERKWKSVHKKLFKKLVKLAPELIAACKDEKVAIVTDEEKAIVNAIKTHLPGIKWFRCYLHAWSNQKLKLRALGITSKKDLAAYKADFISLLKKESYEGYIEHLLSLSEKWDKVGI